MDDLQVGRAFRRVRLRRGWRQIDVSGKARISRSTYSDLERGRLDDVPLRTIRAAARALEIDLGIVARWRGSDLARMLSSRHAAMSETVAARLHRSGWDVRPEVSFSHFGERGVVDLVARHRDLGMLLLVEVKTELVDIGDLLVTMDRRRRLAPVIARSCGWDASVVSSWVVVLDTRTNRRRASQSSVTLRAAFPGDGRAIRRWLADPRVALAALSFLPDVGSGGIGPGMSAVKRVRRPAPASHG